VSSTRLVPPSEVKKVVGVSLNQTSPTGLRYSSEARIIADQLLKHSQRASDGTHFWLKHCQPFDSQGRPTALGPHLYNGASGICFFLAALGYTFDNEELKTTARTCLAPLRRRLAALVANPAEAKQLQLRIGGAVGLGAFLYVFTRMSVWLAEPSLLEEACNIATLLTEERISGDRSLDVMYGSAGALLGLLALEREAPGKPAADAHLLSRAISCGEHLLQQRVASNDKPRAWPYKEGAPMPGFAHGASGIAYALLRLAERTGREEFLAAAFEGLAFEKHHYSSEQANWYSSPERQQSSMIAWCNGAPGVALSRLHFVRYVDSYDSLIQDLEIALDTTRTAKEAISDFPCCGNIGRAEVLLQAACILDRQDLFQAARHLTQRVIERASGHWYGSQAEGSNPAFFRGVSGIGYSLLRFSGVTPLPSVLTWE
jgi:lantibiotic modifying enzyme